MVEYAQVGEYDVSLTVTDQQGTHTQTYANFIEVKEPVIGQLEASHNFNGNANDLTGNEWDATEDGIVFVEDDERGQVAEFNATSSTISNHPGFEGSAARTISAWIKTTTADKVICAFGAKSKTKKWSFRLFTNGKLRVEVEGGYIYGSTVLTDGQWHHVACTFEDDGTPDVADVKLFVDGQLETIEARGSQTVNTAASGSVWIGKDFASTRNFMGRMDDFHIWDRALSEFEIAQLHSVALGVEEVIGDHIQLVGDKKNIKIENTGARTSMKIFNIAGTCLHSFDMPSGTKVVPFDQPGIYIVAIYGGKTIQTKKILLAN
ncbi:MAG: T9SS type A sorting domain-containing protein [Marinilabiliaceae bacterium]|nr:T9SS type A sorting domain-containing protein [Marinilabiliaceae bacterium]